MSSNLMFVNEQERLMKKKYDEISIKSQIQALTEVQNFIEDICDRYNIYNYFGLLSVAVMEAAENAIVHGNKANPEKKVSIKCKKVQGGICVRIEDEGKGFDYGKYNDISDENGKGEGLFLMKSLSNQVLFLNNGKTIELTFFIDGIDASLTLERNSCMQKYFQQLPVVKVNQESKAE